MYVVHVCLPVACQWDSEEDSVNPPAAVRKHEPGNVLELFWVNVCAAVNFNILFYINDGLNVCR